MTTSGSFSRRPRPDVKGRGLAPTWGHPYWATWATVLFVSFLIPEVYALVTNWRNTLSAAVWDFERLVPDQSVWKWSAAHFLFGGVFLLLFGWLVGHFLFGVWR